MTRIVASKRSMIRVTLATIVASSVIVACGSSDSRDRNAVVTVPCAQGGPCRVGETGPGGGIVFQGGDKPADEMWEAAPVNGFGTFDQAVAAVEDFDFGGLTDWVLPTSALIDVMYEQADVFACVEGTDCATAYAPGTYWTADKADGGANAKSFVDGSNTADAVTATYYYRPVRAFRMAEIVPATIATTTTSTTTTTEPPTTTTSSTTTTTEPPTTTTSTSTTTTTTEPPTTTTTIAVVAASDAGHQYLGTNTSSSCAVLVSGSVMCWGRNERGQLGNGESGDDILEKKPVQVVGLDGSSPARTVVQMASRGSYHNCVLTQIAAVQCWGYQYAGQLGDGVGFGGGTPRRETPAVVPGFDGSTANNSGAYVTTGGDTTCAIKLSGALYCWGDNRFGKAGLGSNEFVNRPRMVAGFDGSSPETSAVNVSLGTWFGCAVSGIGAVYCWGQNGSGQLGDGSTTGRTTPIASTSIDGSTTAKRATAVSAGHTNACAVIADGSVKCWGRANSGAFGDSSLTGIITTATAVKDIDGSSQSSRAVSITTSQYHSCALMADQSVKCWGYSNWGQVGVGGTTRSPIVPRGLNASSPVRRVRAISSSAFHTCALLGTNNVDCWGGTGALATSSQQNPQEFENKGKED